MPGKRYADSQIRVNQVNGMRILLTGNTGYITENFISKAFPQYQILIMGNLNIKTDQKKKIVSVPFPEDEEHMRETFAAYGFERVVYFSDYLTFEGRQEGELDRLEKILRYCCEEKGIQMIYLAGPNAECGDARGKSIIAQSAEQLCRYYGQGSEIQIKIVRMPCLYSATYEQDYLYRIFEKMKKGGKLILHGAAGQKMFFLNMDDLAELLFRILDDWDDKQTILHVPDCFGLTFAEFGKALGQLKEGLEVVYEEQDSLWEMPEDDKFIRYRYHWFPKISIKEDLQELYEEYTGRTKEEKKNRFGLIRWLKKHHRIQGLIELLGGCLLMEFLSNLAGDSMQFQMVDFRLLFIVLMGTIYGFNMGVAAAIVESVALVVSYEMEGMDWFALFYDPGNWIPFIVYICAGAVCGYVRMKSRDELSFARSENKLIQEKLDFVQRLYRDTLQDKKEYKRQIIGSQDSFGKIYDITRQLDVARPQEIFIKSIHVIENILNNHTVALYSLGKNKSFARIEASSRGISQNIPRSLKMDDYKAALESMEKDEVWVNTQLLEGYPMYMTGIRRDSNLVMLILIQEADYSQMTLYYVNLLKILCGLIGNSLLRALDYQEAIRKDQYIEGTNIMKESSFMEMLKLHDSMMEQKIADYILLRLNCGSLSLEEADHILQSKIRENDCLGIMEDGTLYLILAQTAQEHVPLVVKRLEQAGFGCEVVSQPMEV